MHHVGTDNTENTDATDVMPTMLVPIIQMNTDE